MRAKRTPLVPPPRSGLINVVTVSLPDGFSFRDDGNKEMFEIPRVVYDASTKACWAWKEPVEASTSVISESAFGFEQTSAKNGKSKIVRYGCSQKRVCSD
ncbi:hypothetical protein GN244_ATG17417 [Phytophthora infestans]|uniref:Uncharacterized protein n=1 Tax=Phytophthora infestans TaxID=4787 RepID=A0A833SHE6_PHYIN|nr:hypothetical protein GN244_ATG17417 [Phytophthora infestans]